MVGIADSRAEEEARGIIEAGLTFFTKWPEFEKWIYDPTPNPTLLHELGRDDKLEILDEVRFSEISDIWMESSSLMGFVNKSCRHILEEKVRTLLREFEPQFFVRLHGLSLELNQVTCSPIAHEEPIIVTSLMNFWRKPDAK